MKKISLIWLLSVISTSNATAQNTLPPAYEINTDTAVNIRLDDAYWQMLEDPGGKWTIDDVIQSPIVDRFHNNTTKIKGFDYSINTFWLRYHFKNSMSHEARIMIPKDVTYADLYTQTSGGGWNKKITGTGVPWSKRDDLKRITSITYTIQPGEELLIYERDNFDYHINQPDFSAINFGFTDKVVQHSYNDNDPSILPSFLFGLCLLAAVFNLYFFLIVRQRVYLFFSLTLLGRESFFLTKNNIFFREDPIVNLYFGHVGVLYWFFLIHFLRYFLETFKYFPRWDKYLFGLSIYVLIWDIIPVQYSDILGPFIESFSILITLIMFLRSSRKVAWLPIVATLPLICITVIASLVFFRSKNGYAGIPVPALFEWVGNSIDVLEQIGLIWLLAFFSWSLFQRYQQLQKTIAQEALAKERLAKEREIERNQLISQQKVELEEQVTERTAELKQSLEELKSTQAQLIQSEKMASLGELTAGIAHEIQNPLNFVNNFSEVNNELIEELKIKNEKLIMQNEDGDLLQDIYQNNEKIILHGKRADAIVKGMLQHSRTGSATKEPTDINKLADEYLRLAYQGFRARDKSFHATFSTDFDSEIGKVNVVPQEIGRVILNLINNAFYAVNEKAKLQSALGGYEPLVSIQTRKPNDRIEIVVKDNGNGIPASIKEKIFQPFFTTKPTGQGTGLGLSLAYDIVKAHGGEIKVQSKEKEGSAFIIQLPTS